MQKIIGNKFFWFNTLGSTNEYLNNAIDNYKEGNIIIAKDQTNGLGMGQNIWESEPYKNLTFSFSLQPNSILAEQQFFLNICISLGVFDFIKSIIPDQLVKVKWPNDIYINEGKVAGILIKNSISGVHILHSIIGIGINCNQLNFKGEAKNPVSLRKYLIHDLDLKLCLEDICTPLNKRYEQLQNNSLDQLKSDYLKALFGTGEWRLYRYKDKLISATIKGISEYGLLLLETREGQKIESDMKEIEFVI